MLATDIGIQGSDLLTLHDLSAQAILDLLHLSAQLAQVQDAPLRGQTIGLLFRKPSTRTRVSFEVAALELGAHSIYMTEDQTQLSRGETIADTARVLSRYLQALVVRTGAHAELEQFAKAARVPVVNALTDRFHPCQVLADLKTIREAKGTLAGLEVAWVGDGNNMLQEWMVAAARLGINLRAACPAGYDPDPQVLALEAVAEHPPKILRSPLDAVQGADVVITDTWLSMGQRDSEVKRQAFEGFTVDEQMMAKADQDAIFLHCLPAHRGEEVTDAVIDGPQSLVFEEAENRLHVQKALLLAILGE
ncbi:MAG: ornithine carbamoyltransferase [Thermaerobacter sp.]|nr:ornithine carbamoyltransferase [Thermaerobacter sp.]